MEMPGEVWRKGVGLEPRFPLCIHPLLLLLLGRQAAITRRKGGFSISMFLLFMWDTEVHGAVRDTV